MLVIRFFRVGKKNQPVFKIVVTDKTKPPRAGRFVEEVGVYNPKTKEKTLNAERAKYWISVGAQPSPRVHNLLLQEKIIEGKKIAVHKKGKTEVKPTAEQVQPAELVKEETLAAEKSVASESPKEEKPEEEKPEEEKPVTEIAADAVKKEKTE